MRELAKSLLIAAGILISIGAPFLAQETDDEALDSTRDTLAKWIETRQLISKEREEWRLGKEVLDERVSLVKSEIGTLESRIGEIRDAIRESDTKRDELSSENRQLENASKGLQAAIGRLETDTRRLLAAAPEPVRERVTALSRRLPANPDSTDMALSERFMNVIGILNEINKFNRDITMTSELRELPDGKTAEVTALYVGISLGYYVTADGTAAGIGGPSSEGWTWKPANELADDVTHAIAVLKNEDVPAYVPLPVGIR